MHYRCLITFDLFHNFSSKKFGSYNYLVYLCSKNVNRSQYVYYNIIV